MKSFIKFFSKGFLLSIPISLLGVAGTEGGAPGMAWFAMAVGLPWDIIGLGTVLAAILTHGMDKMFGNFLIISGLIWTFLSINLNCSILISVMEKIPSFLPNERKKNEETT